MRCALTTTSVDVVMAEADIPPQYLSGKKLLLQLIPSPFEERAQTNGYEIAPAVSPCLLRQYADSGTQVAYRAYRAGSAETARMVTESTLETEALRERIQGFASGTVT